MDYPNRVSSKDFSVVAWGQKGKPVTLTHADGLTSDYFNYIPTL